MVKTRYLLTIILALAILVPAVIAVPTITVVSPTDQTTYNETFNISAELNEASNVSFTYSDAPANYSMSLINDTSYIYYNDSFTFTKGNFINFTFYAESVNGTDETTVSINISNSAPDGNISDMPSPITNNDSITIDITVTDADGIADVDSVDFYYYNNASEVYALIATETVPVGDVFNTTWNTTLVADNETYQIRANISDGDDVTEVVSNFFAVGNSNNAPTVSLTYPNEDGLSVSGTINITWTATDIDNNTLTVQLYYSENSGTSWTEITGINSDNDGSENWDTTTVGSDNNYKIKVIAADIFGAQAAEKSAYDFTINNAGTGGGDDDDGGGGDSSFGSGGGLGDTTGYDFSLIISVIEPGTSEIVEIDNDDLSFTKLTINVARTVGDVRIKIKDLDSSPTTVSPAGETYQYLQVDTTNIPDVDIATAIIDFKIPKSWITSNSLNKDTVDLKRYANNGWRDLTTTYVRAEGDYYYYSANTPGFSYFAIVAKEGAAAAVEEVGTEAGEAPEGTGFLAGVTGGSIADMFGSTNSIIGIIVAIVVIMAFTILIARRKLGARKRRRLNLPTIKVPDASGRAYAKSSKRKLKFPKIRVPSASGRARPRRRLRRRKK